jgi:hypothetical protein
MLDFIPMCVRIHERPPGDKKSAMGKSGAIAQKASSNPKRPKYILVVAKCPSQNTPT